MTQWLLKHEGYPPAVIVSVLLHVLLLLVIFFWNKDNKELLRIEQPASIVATAVKDNPQRVRQQETKRKQQQQVAQEKARVQEQERQHQETLVKEEVERQKIAQLHKQQELDQKRKQEDQKQQQQKVQDQKQQTVAKEQDQKRDKEKQQQAARDETQRQSELAKQQAAMQRALTEEQQLVANYKAKIQELIESSWNKPAGAGKNILAHVELQLTPTGEIVASRIVQSSGDANFDRSVLQAVSKAGNFNFLKELDYAVFNTYFRKFTLEFKPDDLPL